MRMYDIIQKKKIGAQLTEAEIRDMIAGYVTGEIPDYQMSAMLMAIYFTGMSDQEMTWLTMAMAESGEMVDLSVIPGVKADKHSTGGVGDKTTLIVAPIVAACGIKVAKMSGRGLGHTGGTVDKLEAIPGFQTAISQTDFFRNVARDGISVIGQTGNLAPADKKLYALRDVTATVDSIPLIASSIMSKKLAAGSDVILLDVKTGSGAFMKTLEDSILLAEKMVAIGNGAGRKCAALITDMDVPLGHAIGNSLEVIEAIETLKGRGPEDLTAVCFSLASHMLSLSGSGSVRTCQAMVRDAVKSGAAYNKLVAMVRAQGGDTAVIENPDLFEKAACQYVLTADKAGYITGMDTEGWGIAAACLGAGRQTKDDQIDYSAGILLHKKYGDQVTAGEAVATLFAGSENLFASAAKKARDSFVIENNRPVKKNQIYAEINKDGCKVHEIP